MMAPRLLTPEIVLELPRLSGLRLSPDGRTLAFVVARQSLDRKKYVSDLHRLSVSGGDPERLTVGETSDGAPRFLPDGSLIFLTARPDNDPKTKQDKDDEPTAQIWALPSCGEPRAISRRALGIEAMEAARGASTVVFTSYVYPDAKDDADNRAREKARKESGVTALEFDRIPIRFWDRFHGPRFRHLFVGQVGALESARDLTPEARLDHDDEQGFALSPDGRTACMVVTTFDRDFQAVENLVLIDVATGAARKLTDERHSYTSPHFSPDGRSLAAILHYYEAAKTGRSVLALFDLESGKRRLVSEAFDLWPNEIAFSADGMRIYFTADQEGEIPVFALDLASLSLRRVSARGGFSDLQPSPDGKTIYALWSTWDRPPEVVALDADATDGAPKLLTRFSSALDEVTLGKVETIHSTSPDGRKVQSFLVRAPSTDRNEKKPLVLWVHGGPLGAWSNHWHWRWNPHLFAARGFQLLLPNPRISMGYGQDFIEEGFQRWGGEPYVDLMAAVDEACKRPYVDAARLAAMGGSYGGYMANWIAGQTTRFSCIVTHASLWHLSGFHGTTDCGPEWEREFGNPYLDPEQYERWSPHQFVKQIKTPMLVIHGERDYRVPVSEAYQLFTALQRLNVPSKFLYFPDEHHWVLKPNNSALWHQSVFEWLDRWLAK
jgi:dipeptidyl aminopeptidase/acylaminoacyl peptidase